MARGPWILIKPDLPGSRQSGGALYGTSVEERTETEIPHTFELFHRPADADGDRRRSPLLEFHSISEIGGLDYVEAVRFGDKVVRTGKVCKAPG